MRLTNATKGSQQIVYQNFRLCAQLELQFSIPNVDV
jgi:hypothetical protein